ncbi:hypothetical protein GQ457_14G025750 [Hibiscus cannabinus]
MANVPSYVYHHIILLSENINVVVALASIAREMKLSSKLQPFSMVTRPQSFTNLYPKAPLPVSSMSQTLKHVLIATVACFSYMQM